MCLCRNIPVDDLGGVHAVAQMLSMEGNFVHLFLTTCMQVSGLEPPLPRLVWQVLLPTEPSPQPHTACNHAPYVMRAMKEHLESLEKISGR